MAQRPMHARRDVLVAAAALLGACVVPGSRTDGAHARTCDVLVLGGTPAGLMCAIEAARRGAHVIVLERHALVGGMCTAGLGFSDTGRKEVIGGLAREFFQRLWRHYESDGAWRVQAREAFGNRGQGTPALDGEARTMWLFEASAARRVLEVWLAEPQLGGRIDVQYGAALDRCAVPSRVGSRLSAIATTDGRRFEARVFVDATYEGDLLALADAPFVVGRESSAEFDEDLAGVRTLLATKNQFPAGVDPYVVAGDRDSGLLPGVCGALLPDGSADRGVQAYCFRLALTDVPSNRVPITVPSDYDERDHELLLRSIEAGQSKNFLTLDLLPNRKTDSNNWGGASSDFVGQNHDYPLASDSQRAAIVSAHERWQRGHLWTLQNHPRVPAAIREFHAPWGLAADEHVATGNWPCDLYVREARRLRSDFVMTQRHVQLELPCEEPIAMGSYNIDSHNVWRHVGARGDVCNEGDVQVRLDAPYGIELKAMLPPTHVASNLIVPVCVSSTHVAFGSLRMEPVFMALGQAAGALAALALDADRAVQEVPYATLRAELLARGAVLD